MTFPSDIRQVGRLTFPAFTGVRVMMMPVRLEDAATVPMLQWRKPFSDLVALSRVKRGVAYLTIDEALVQAGETHRRPGLHVDGVGPEGRAAGWGGGGGWGGARPLPPPETPAPEPGTSHAPGQGAPWASSGMLVAASVLGCQGWDQEVEGAPGPNGDCAHLRAELRDDRRVLMDAGTVFWCSPLAVHESVIMAAPTRRTFVRLSMPNDCPWYEGYTRNPLGVEPTGPVHPRRAEQMAYRP